MPADPRRSGHPLRRSRRGVGAHRACAGSRRLRPGDRVAVQVDKHWHVLALYLACLRAGLVYLPLNTGYQKTELAVSFSTTRQPRVDRLPSGARWAMVATLAHEATVLTIDANGGGELHDRAAAEPGAVRNRAVAAGRSRGDPLHVGHDRPLQGRDADASQPRVERAGARRGVGLHPRRRAAARAADLPRARAVRRDPLRAAVRCAACSGCRNSTRRRSSRSLPRATVMMGVPTFYTRLLAEPTFTRDVCGIDAPVRLGLGAAARPRRSTRFARAPGTRSSSATA